MKDPGSVGEQVLDGDVMTPCGELGEQLGDVLVEAQPARLDQAEDRRRRDLAVSSAASGRRRAMWCMLWPPGLENLPCDARRPPRIQRCRCHIRAALLLYGGAGELRWD